MTQDELLRTFTYAAENGILTWKARPREDFPTARGWNCFNARFAGKAAGCCVYKKGDRMAMHILYQNKKLAAHRVIWTIVNGPISPSLQIDHINGDPFDNRLCNLRLATRSENGMNRGANRNNVTGLKGVSKYRNGFRARIMVHGKEIGLGIHATKGLAAVARAKASIRYHGGFARVA